jgi:hypothetical protein
MPAAAGAAAAAAGSPTVLGHNFVHAKRAAWQATAIAATAGNNHHYSNHDLVLELFKSTRNAPTVPIMIMGMWHVRRATCCSPW